MKEFFHKLMEKIHVISPRKQWIFISSIIFSVILGLATGYMLFDDKEKSTTHIQNQEATLDNEAISLTKNSMINPNPSWPSSDYMPQTSDKGKLAIIIYDIQDIHAESEPLLLSLPKKIAFCLHPLLSSPQKWQSTFSKAGYKLLIPLTLATSLPDVHGNTSTVLHKGMPLDEIERRFNLLLSGYKNVSGVMGLFGLGGDLFYEDQRSVAHLLTLCRKNNFFFIRKDLDETGRFRSTFLYEKLCVAHFCIHSLTEPENAIFKNAVSLSKMTGKALLVVKDHPKILYQLKQWITTLNKDNISLVSLDELY
jgi:polysaccharide deacetylase 2 family uncharacterized protein YibQ